MTTKCTPLRPLYAFLLLFLFPLFSQAQNESLDSVNMELRQLFSPLARPANPQLFLYDMAAHMSDSVYYQNQCPVTHEPAIWYKVYEEVFHSAYDTTPYLHPDTVYYRGKSY